MTGRAAGYCDPASSGIVFNIDYVLLARNAGVQNFDKIMQLPGVPVKQVLPWRTTVQLQVCDADRDMTLYLKRHYRQPLGSFLVQVLKAGRRPPTAFDEFQHINAFHRCGIPTMTPVAAGIRRSGFFRTESFLLTLALEGCVRLDHLLSGFGSLGLTVKRALVINLALLVRKMHACGFNHRDLYLCHILRNPAGELFVVDLHRVQQRPRVPERWRVKDLAALQYSAPADTISRAERLRFLKTYLAAERLSAGHKRFILKILKKTEKMVQHNAKKT